MTVKIRLRIGKFEFQLRIGEFPKYLKKNPGAPFVLTFVLTLIIDLAIYSSNRVLSDNLTTNAFAILVIGVILQGIAIARHRDKSKRMRPRMGESAGNTN